MRRFFWGLLAVAATACNTVGADAPVPLPDPAVDEQLTAVSSETTAVVAGGCFWGVEAVFEHLKGVKRVATGYAGGSAATAHYDIVSEGRTSHAESVKVVYDPSQITYGRLLKVFFSVAHDPTEVDRQGPDAGPQYRSAIFATPDQQRIAEAYITQLNQAGVFKRKIATRVSGPAVFYDAEGHHQDYVVHNPGSPYVRAYDLPKLDHLRKQFPDLYRK